MIADTNPVVSKLDTLIRARYPIIAVSSHEEKRVVETLTKIAASKKHDKAVYTWTISKGLVRVWPVPGDDDSDAVHSDLADPVAALKYVLSLRADKTQVRKHKSDGFDPRRAIFIFEDLHRYFADAVIVRLLRDVALELRERHQTVVLLSPTFGGWGSGGQAEGMAGLPSDLEKDVIVVDFPLPTPDELADLLERFASGLPEKAVVNLDGARESIVRAMQGLTETEAEAVVAQATIARNGHLDQSAIGFVLDAKAQLIKKSGALEYYPEQTEYSQIGGLDLLKMWCTETEVAFSDGARDYGIEAPKGLLLVGIPGCGKSLTAKSVAGGARPLLRLDVGALIGSLLGQSEAQTRSALKIAEAIAPVVLWIDEMEKALGDDEGESNGGTLQRVLGTILTWMQETKAPVFVVATANDADRLRPELVQRFDETFFVDLPTDEERADILRIHLIKRQRDPMKFDLAEIAAAMTGFAGREIEKVVKTALRRAFKANREVTTDDLLTVTGETVPLSTTMASKIEKMREWARRARPASSRQTSGHQQPAGISTGRALEM